MRNYRQSQKQSDKTLGGCLYIHNNSSNYTIAIMIKIRSYLRKIISIKIVNLYPHPPTHFYTRVGFVGQRLAHIIILFLTKQSKIKYDIYHISNENLYLLFRLKWTIFSFCLNILFFLTRMINLRPWMVLDYFISLQSTWKLFSIAKKYVILSGTALKDKRKGIYRSGLPRFIILLPQWQVQIWEKITI